jgi:hypothetical protein
MDREYGGLSRYLARPVGINAPDLEQLRRTLLVN